MSLLVLTSCSSGAPADDFAAAQRADEQRIAATIAGDTDKLATLLSDKLHYAHSDGRVQSKEEFLSAVAGNRIKYLSFVPHDVKLQSIAPGAVAMNGRARISAEAGGRRVDLTLRFLAVWREESGQWRLLAYQSSQLQDVSSR